MTQNERKAESIRKELEKLHKSLDRYMEIQTKKVAKCESLNCNWNHEEFFRNRDAETMSQAQWEAYFDRQIADHNVDDTQSRIQNAETRLQKVLPIVDAETARAEDAQRVQSFQDGYENYWNAIGRGEDSEELERQYKEWERKFRAECERDGIKIDLLVGKIFSGWTPTGKKFWCEDNNGDTERSLHCSCLWIDKECVFTSGDFSTVYNTIRRR